MIEQIHAYELNLITFVQQLRGPLTDVFFKFLNFFDSLEFIFILGPAIWIGYHWKVGIKLFYIVVLNAFLNHFLKELFHQPRPFLLDPYLAVIHANGYGFPSGGAQSAVILGGMLIHLWKSKWAWVIGLNYIFWISLSRIYLGVHFPTDVLGGWIFGSLLLFAYLSLYPYVEAFLKRQSYVVDLIMAIVMPLLFLLLNSSSSSIRLVLVAIGIGMGTIISSSQHLFLDYPKKWFEFVLRAIWGVAGTFAIYKLIPLLPIENRTILLMLSFLLIGFWVSLGANLIKQEFIKLYNVKERE